MRHTIAGFAQDDDHHWRAKLECGHYQHVRHDPPLTTREWVLTEQRREEKIGAVLDCKKCCERLPRDF